MKRSVPLLCLAQWSLLVVTHRTVTTKMRRHWGLVPYDTPAPPPTSFPADSAASEWRVDWTTEYPRDNPSWSLTVVRNKHSALDHRHHHIALFPTLIIYTISNPESMPFRAGEISAQPMKRKAKEGKKKHNTTPEQHRV